MELPATLVFDHPTVSAISAFVGERLSSTLAATPHSAAARNAGPAPQAPVGLPSDPPALLLVALTAFASRLPARSSRAHVPGACQASAASLPAWASSPASLDDPVRRVPHDR